MKKAILLLAFVLLLTSTSFAAGDWLAPTMIAIVASVCILALLFMFGYAFHLDELTMTAKEELYQVIVVALIAGSLLGISGALDSISKGISGEDESFPALALEYVNEDSAVISEEFNKLAYFSNEIGSAGSRSLSCTFMSISIGVSGCGGYNAMVGTMSTVFQGLGIAMAEWGSMKFLLGFAQIYAFGMLLPFGLFLRVFKFTRGAGAVIIALAVALYVFLPTSIFLMHNILVDFEASPAAAQLIPADKVLPNVGCDPYDGFDLSNYNSAKNVMLSASGLYGYYAYLIVVKTTLTVVVSVIVMLAGLRFVSSLAGADVDVSILGRLA
ncbi:MAG: hypothetical protein ABII22_03220 [Candidatus Micrarchaeota archaeon]